jgi:1-acyl-sn-glycerol-3-phosphate acyltransferase
MIVTFLYFFYLAFIFLLSTVFFIPVFFLWLFRLKKAREAYVNQAAKIWARHMIFMAGGRVSVTGRENLPPSHQFAVIGNHQGFADIPLILGYLGYAPGFVAKKELFRVPFMSWWMSLLHCIPLDRKSPRQAVKAIEKAANNIRSGKPMLIFPEGTRSRTGRVGAFKAGSLTMAVKSGTPILPVTINGTAQIWEAKKRIAGGKISLTIHPPIQPEEYSRMSKIELAEKLQAIVSRGLIQQEIRRPIP